MYHIIKTNLIIYILLLFSFLKVEATERQGKRCYFLTPTIKAIFGLMR